MRPNHTKADHDDRLRVLVLDVDGTLLDPSHRISPANRAAVRRAAGAGLHVLLASGRSPYALRGILQALGLDGPAIGFTGAVTFRLEGGAIRVLAESPVARDAAETVWALAAGAGIEVGWYTADGWRAVARGPGVVEEAASTDEPAAIDPALPAGAPLPLKLMCIAPPAAADGAPAAAGPASSGPPTPALVALRDALPAGVHGVFSHPRYLEVTAAGVDKAVAVEAACAALGVPPPRWPRSATRRTTWRCSARRGSAWPWATRSTPCARWPTG